MTATASSKSPVFSRPMARAPRVATAIRKFSSNICRFRMPLNAFRRMSYPMIP